MSVYSEFDVVAPVSITYTVIPEPAVESYKYFLGMSTMRVSLACEMAIKFQSEVSCGMTSLLSTRLLVEVVLEEEDRLEVVEFVVVEFVFSIQSIVRGASGSMPAIIESLEKFVTCVEFKGATQNAGPFV